MSLEEKARIEAAQMWCLPQHAHKEMDAEFAETIAKALSARDKRIEELEAELDWKKHKEAACLVDEIATLKQELDAANGEPHADRCHQSKRLKIQLAALKQERDRLREVLIRAEKFYHLIKRYDIHLREECMNEEIKVFHAFISQEALGAHEIIKQTLQQSKDKE